MAIKSWKDMHEPVSLEEHAGEIPVPPPRPHLEGDVSESVTVTGTRPPGKGDDWEVRAYFTNPGNRGHYAAPLPGAHTGFKVYRGGQFQYSLDAGPTGPNLKTPQLGNLRFQGTKEELGANKKGINSLKEIPLTPPKGTSGEMFARQLAQAAQDYDGSRPYKMPDVDPNPSPFRSSFGGPDPDPINFRFANVMRAGEYNSNSFAAGLLGRVGAASNIPVIQKHIANRWAAPGLEQPLPQQYFRKR